MTAQMDGTVMGITTMVLRIVVSLSLEVWLNVNTMTYVPQLHYPLLFQLQSLPLSQQRNQPRSQSI